MIFWSRSGYLHVNFTCVPGKKLFHHPFGTIMSHARLISDTLDPLGTTYHFKILRLTAYLYFYLILWDRANFFLVVMTRIKRMGWLLWECDHLVHLFCAEIQWEPLWRFINSRIINAIKHDLSTCDLYVCDNQPLKSRSGIYWNSFTSLKMVNWFACISEQHKYILYSAYPTQSVNCLTITCDFVRKKNPVNTKPF